ncbi:hypothetical protein MIMGU_mgv1a024785mg, partial [Erythranthe guttata]
MTISFNDDDRISRLPDDILVDILSLLRPDKAARTSVLSSRWINLWKHTPSLHFNGSLKFEQRKCVKMVNSVIQSHKSPTLKKFRITFPLDRPDSTNLLTRWLEFAFFRQRHFPEVYNIAPRSSTLSEFKSLKSLSFKGVNVSGRAIEFLLRNCPRLEQLIVSHSQDKTSKIEVCGSSLVLKHLKIAYCSALESLKISAPSLTSLGLTSLEGVLLENVPMLVDVSVNCDYYSPISIKKLFSVTSRCISQLETLKLGMLWFPTRKGNDELGTFPQMPKLKKLFIEYGPFDEATVTTLAYFTSASPYLQEFVLENKYKNAKPENIRMDDVAASGRFRHEHIKVFKFRGYHGRPIDDAIVACVLENFVVLEKIIIDPSGVSSLDIFSRLETEKTARESAKQHLQPQLPHRVEL